ncbi:hypothetical protein [Bacteroides bouchesdurhonensis]|uniref:hypothetical protein n=1 Tax=Bacteroides bouchesdurhonensis TaxID=1841855 RepID=UPI00097F6FE6|nr:hypothetical protein [Bacteroides bouchesdurhonensis]
MKKLVLMAVAIAAVSFASCGNKAADAQKAQQDSIRIADSIAAAQSAVEEAPVIEAEKVDTPTVEVGDDAKAATETEEAAKAE